MGCVISKRRETHFSKNLPSVNIDVGSNIKPMEIYTSNRRIVFVFGGPGSRKGRVVNDLVQGYGFKVISAEKLILTHFAKRERLHRERDVTGNTESTKEVEQLLKTKPQLLTLQWVLEIISSELEIVTKDYNGLVLVDLVPNLRAMLQGHTFIKKCEKEMEKFEETWPCLFALNLAIPDDKVMENLKALVAKNPNHLLKNGLSDEKDIMKTKRRYEEYASSVKEFLHYFKSTHRLATVDVSCGVADLIWTQVTEFFFNMGFKPKNSLNTVILFSFREDDLSLIDLSKYRMESVVTRSLVHSESPSLEEVFDCISNYIEKSKVTVEYFAVHLEDLNVLQQLQQQEKRQIFFLDENQLHHYIYIGKDAEKNAGDLPYRAVCTTENEICLFPEDFDIDTCKQITLLYIQAKVKTKGCLLVAKIPEQG